MIYPDPSFKVKVDLANPGQFFACCGLLELAYRCFRGNTVEGWFSNDYFYVATGDVKSKFYTIARALEATQIQSANILKDKAILPVRLEGFKITLNWWVDERGNKTVLKLWAGHQTAIKIVKQMRDALNTFVDASPEDILNASKQLTGRFGFDPRSAWNALDAGFSPNEQGVKVITYPAVELFAAIGLQRFRPTVKSGEARSQVFGYSSWSVPMPVTVANTAAAGLVPAGSQRDYTFRVVDRGSYKGFDYAIQTGG